MLTVMALFLETKEKTEETMKKLQETYIKIEPELEEVCKQTFDKTYDILTSKSLANLTLQDKKELDKFTILNNLKLCNFIFKEQIKNTQQIRSFRE